MTTTAAGCLRCGSSVFTDDPAGWLRGHREFVHEGRRLYIIGTSGSPERCRCGRVMRGGRCDAPPDWLHDGGWHR